MLTVTGGTVRYEDGTKAKEDYAPAKKAAVELRFDVAVDEDHTVILNHASSLAMAKVNEMLGLRATAARVEPLVSTSQAPKPASTEKPVVKTDKELLADKVAAENAGAKKTTKKAAPAPVAPEDALDEGDPKPAKPAQAQATTAADDLDDLLGEAPVKPVSDADLGAAAQKKNGAMKDTAGWSASKIRDLVMTYASEPGKVIQLRDIPQEKRHEFLAKLDALS